MYKPYHCATMQFIKSSGGSLAEWLAYWTQSLSTPKLTDGIFTT